MSDFRIECYAGYRGDESPTAVIVGGQRYPVAGILQQWQEPGRRCFKLRLVGGSECLVCHDAATDSWLEIGHRLAVRG